MEILSMRTIHGPSVYHNKPIIMMKVQLGEWTDTPSDEKPEFVCALTNLLPGLGTHECSKGYAGGFLERLGTGTYLAHIIEHVALELSTLAGIEVTYGKTRYAGAHGKYEIVTRFQNEAGMRHCLQAAFELVKALFDNRPFDLAREIETVRELVSDTKLGPSGQSILDAAIHRGIPWRRVGNDSLLQLGYGKNRRFVQAAVTDRTGLIATETVQDKDLTKTILRKNGLPVPFGAVVRTFEEVEACRREIAGPCVIKPIDGNHGNGVSLNISESASAKVAFDIAKEISRSVLVEEMCFGRDYRVLCIGAKVVAAAERRPPFITGDGKRTVAQLIDELNADPRREDGHAGVLTKIVIEELLLESLAKRGVTLDSIVEAGREIVLRENANLSSGGTAIDVTDEIHPTVRAICERAARIAGLDICGLDLIHRDIRLPADKTLKIIEVNAGPGLRMHLAPVEGKARDVGGAIVDMIYPEPSKARIPILSVTGTNGKTTVTRLLAKIMGARGACVGMTTTDGIWIDGQCVMKGDTTGPVSSEIVLSDPAVDVAVLEVARGGMLRAGLAYDWSDVSVVTNIQPDHFGQDGIEELEDLVWIKSLVAERVKPGGHLVLNADDPQSLGLRSRRRIQKVEKNIFLYSTTGKTAEFIEHFENGGDAAWFEKGRFMLKRGTKIFEVLKVADVKIAMGGLATFQVSNVLAAIAMASCAGCDVDQIRDGVQAFEAASENVGRLNLYRIREGYLIVDYAHNPQAIQAVCSLVKNLKGFKHTAVFGLPGDRTEELLVESCSKVAGVFDEIYLKEDFDLRGHAPGEVARLMDRAIREKDASVVPKIILNERAALSEALAKIGRNEVVTFFYDQIDRSFSVVRDFDPVPVTSIELITDFVPPGPTGSGSTETSRTVRKQILKANGDRGMNVRSS